VRIRTAAILALIVITVALPTVAATDVGTVYERMSRIADKLDCPVCQGQSVKESNSQLAQQMRHIIDEKIAAGASDEDIWDFFAERYGQGVLRDPPKEGFALGLWIGPIVASAIGVLAVSLVLMQNRSWTTPDAPTHLTNVATQVDQLRKDRDDNHP
jgi:cytochrome c-type biogenesis protein CcmH